jgi:hypothetical protein
MSILSVRTWLSVRRHLWYFVVNRWFCGQPLAPAQGQKLVGVLCIQRMRRPDGTVKPQLLYRMEKCSTKMVLSDLDAQYLLAHG